MRKAVMAAAMAAAVLATGGASLPDKASQSDRLIFADRDLAGAAAKAPLAWRLVREGKAAAGFAPLADGLLSVVPVTDPDGGDPMLEMRETASGTERVVGRYPANGMDPVLVYFLESATRNVSALAGGNPDYIRNRFKDAMRKGGEVGAAPAVGATEASGATGAAPADGGTKGDSSATGSAPEGSATQGSAQRVTLRPLAGDPNAARMRGFDALSLTIDLAPDPSLPIAALAATAPGYALRLTRVAP
ncbi:hypothetical protein DRW48_12640 [Paracoccus suum]|uniref:Uncharacterized protein n=2 Tax=Paracoccus suum TaxID=2259340 RepID=A0A344PM12_9RHOB|nr:hypothetical protein DRW48_12640 [Paracoccus suum]